MIKYEALTKQSFSEMSLYNEIISEVQEDYINGNEDSYMAVVMRLEGIANDFRVKTDFLKRIKTIVDKRLGKLRAEYQIATMGNGTAQCSYDTTVYPVINTGAQYIITDNGIVFCGPDGNSTICPVPVLPVAEYRSRETGERKIKLIFRDNRLGWTETVVDAEVISNKNKIVSLAALGIPINSCNALQMVHCLNTLRYTNTEVIPIGESTHKLGWSKDGKFLPYEADKTVIYDGVNENARLWDALTPAGTEEDFIDAVKTLRSRSSWELQCAMSAALASVLVKIVGVNSFCVDIHGRGGKGKTTVAKLAAAQFGDPEELVQTFDFSVVGLELRKDILNSLPLILDESSSMTDKLRANLESIIYSMCNDRGRLRGTKNLGNDAMRTWRNVTIITGEDAITSYLNKTGVMLRVIEIDAGNKQIFSSEEDADLANRTPLKNYGWIGKRFIEAVQSLGENTIYEKFTEHKRTLKQLIGTDDSSEIDKQLNSMALIMTADEIATDNIYKDDKTLKHATMVNMIASIGEVNINIRAYNDFSDLVSSNQQRFVKQLKGNGETVSDFDANIEQWGIRDVLLLDTYYIYPLAFKTMLKTLGYSPKTFAGWLAEQGLLDCGGGSQSKVFWIDGEAKRLYAVTVGRQFDKNGRMVEEPKQQKQEAQPKEQKQEPTPEQLGFMDIPAGEPYMNTDGAGFIPYLYNGEAS